MRRPHLVCGPRWQDGFVLFEDRARAESFGAAAELYDRARPSYPSELIDGLLADEPGRVLDVGCGTGIASTLLGERGCAVLGVEVDPRMAELARRKGLEVEVAPFEQWDARGRRFDLVICAQAWHWIEPHVGVAKVAAVLDAGGRFAVFWNFGDPPTHVRERLAPIYRRLEPGLENYSVVLGHHHERAPATLTDINQAGSFEGVSGATFPWRKTYDTAQWLEHLDSHSDHRGLSVPRRRRLLAAVGEAIDAVGGSFEMPYETVLISARRT